MGSLFSDRAMLAQRGGGGTRAGSVIHSIVQGLCEVSLSQARCRAIDYSAPSSPCCCPFPSLTACRNAVAPLDSPTG